MKRWLITLALLGGISSCASFEEQHKQWLATNCNTDASYSNGVGDAENDQPHDTAPYSDCPATQEGEIKKAYSEGYRSTNNNPIRVLKQVMTKNYYKCSISIFGQTYEGSSENEGKAKSDVIGKCQKRWGIHCQQATCQKF